MAVVAIDFDHTLVEGEKAIPYAKEAVNILRENGHKIIIYSANNIHWIDKVLRNNDIRYDKLWAGIGKPNCDIYIDDKGWRFTGSWQDDLDPILTLIKDLDNRKWK